MKTISSNAASTPQDFTYLFILHVRKYS